MKSGEFSTPAWRTRASASPEFSTLACRVVNLSMSYEIPLCTTRNLRGPHLVFMLHKCGCRLCLFCDWSLYGIQRGTWACLTPFQDQDMSREWAFCFLLFPRVLSLLLYFVLFFVLFIYLQHFLWRHYMGRMVFDLDLVQHPIKDPHHVTIWLPWESSH